MNKPVKIEQFDKKIKKILHDSKKAVINFDDTETAFAYKTGKELRQTYWLYSMMNKEGLVNLGIPIMTAAIKLRLPLVPLLIKKTIFKQFCGGTTLLNSAPTIENLYKYKAQTILDYGAEAKTEEKDFNFTMNENIRAIEYATTYESTPIISTKITGLTQNTLLEALSTQNLNAQKQEEYQNALKRIDTICNIAHKRGIGVFFDAEESWLQDGIDHFVDLMMSRYNKEKVVVYNTFQMYRKKRYDFLVQSHKTALANGYLLGAKLVRGAYMEKERKRAKEVGYASPIQDTKQDTDKDYNRALMYCLEHYETIGSCAATHNKDSSLLQATLLNEMKISNNHPHILFSQLYGMSDNITFNLAKKGYNSLKYVPYGRVEEVIPFLIRRAQENTSVTGDMSREFQLVKQEMKRRKLL